jgi:hypothetical protein
MTLEAELDQARAVIERMAIVINCAPAELRPR